MQEYNKSCEGVMKIFEENKVVIGKQRVISVEDTTAKIPQSNYDRVVDFLYTCFNNTFANRYCPKCRERAQHRLICSGGEECPRREYFHAPECDSRSCYKNLMSS